MASTEVGNLAAEIMDALEEYANATTEGLKKAVEDAGKTVKKEINANAPTDTGAYAKSWSVKKASETGNSIAVSVYSPKRYWQAHLLEHGHAKRNGGRVAAQPHIADAEATAIEQLEKDLEKVLQGG